MVKTLAPAILLAWSTLGGCKGPPLPGPKGKSAALVAIQVRTLDEKHRSGVPEVVYFVRKGDEGKVHESTLVRGSYAFLLNAEPGTYTAVASMEQVEGKDHFTFFSEDCVQETGTTVQEGQRAYMGLLRLRHTYGLARADETQRRFSDLIDPNPNPTILSTIFKRKLHFTETGHRLDYSRKRQDAFQEHVRKYLGRSGW